MAGEEFLLSGDQIATYTNSNVTFPGGETNIELTGLSALGDASSRFLLVRQTGNNAQVSNGDHFGVFEAIDDGSGGFIPGPTEILAATFATPDAFNDTGAGDQYVIFGLFGGTKYVVNLEGFQGAGTFTVVQDDEPEGGDNDGELDLVEIEAADPEAAICFTAGTRILTPHGEIPIEALQAGDLIQTRDDGLKPVLWSGASTVRAKGALAPVVFAAGVIGNTRPLALSPLHRILITGWRAGILFGSDECLAHAKDLINDHSIRRREGRSVTYHHLLLERHQVIMSEGAWSESLFLGDQARNSLLPEARREVEALFPEIAPIGGQHAADTYGTTARRCLRRHEARVYAAYHSKVPKVGRISSI